MEQIITSSGWSWSWSWSDSEPNNSESSDQDQLVRELLDDDSPLFLPPENDGCDDVNDDDKKVNELVNSSSAAVAAALSYSGPTIEDIENALSVTPRNDQLLISDQTISHSDHRFSTQEKNLSKIEHKYTLRMKSCGNLIADDGYKWRKYGQKSIKNSPNPRSYYRCSNPRCSAKKQVERSVEDPDIFVITYEGLHLHFAYPFFTMGQAQQIQLPTKKPRRIDSDEAQAQNLTQSPNLIAPDLQQPDDQDEVSSPQGLLEDVVPWMIRNPTNPSSCSSYRTRPHHHSPRVLHM